MKPQIKFRAMVPSDHGEFTAATHYYPSSQFGGIVAWSFDGQRNTIMGMVGFDSWTNNSVMIHWFIKHPRCILPLWDEVRGYLALHGKKKCIGSTPGDNVRALRMIFNKLGFREIARIKDGIDAGIDIVISEYLIHGQHDQSNAERAAEAVWGRGSSGWSGEVGARAGHESAGAQPEPQAGASSARLRSATAAA